MSNFGFGKVVELDFEAAIERVTEALAVEGFGVLTTIDVQATLKAKLDEDMRPYRILGACNPKLADQVLTDDPNAGTLLPCNFIVREASPGSIVVSFMDPEAVLGLTDSEAAKDVGRIAKEKLQRVVGKLRG